MSKQCDSPSLNFHKSLEISKYNLIGKKQKVEKNKAFDLKYKVTTLQPYKTNLQVKKSLNNVDIESEKESLSKESNDYLKQILELDSYHIKYNIKNWLKSINISVKSSLKTVSIACSPNLTIYQLPLNLHELESMSALEYLSKFLVVFPIRRKLIELLFYKFKTEDGSNEFLLRQDLVQAIREFHNDSAIDLKTIENMFEFLGFGGKIEQSSSQEKHENEIRLSQMKKKFSIKTKYNNFVYKEFEALCLFSEKYFYDKKLIQKKFSLFDQLNILEYLDFKTLLAKLDSVRIDPNLLGLLKFIAINNFSLVSD